MGFWKNFRNSVIGIAKIAAQATVDTMASGKPITLGNLGKSTAGVVAKKKG